MELTIKNISFDPTGDPFIDLGGLVLKKISERFPEKSITEIIQYAINVYIKNWNQKLHSIFHTNSKILNPSTRGRHAKNTKEYFNMIIKNEKFDNCLENEYCKTCGKQGLLYPNSREFFPNSGSGAFINFHHAHETGIFICDDCTIKLFFVPLGVIVIGGKNGFLHSQSQTMKDFWLRRIIEENLNKITRNSSEGILRTEYNNPENTLFHFAGEIIQQVQDDQLSEYLQLFNFTNFGAVPDCIIYTLPNPVFNFLNKVLRFYKKQWQQFIRRHFRIKGVEWDQMKLKWSRSKKSEIEILTEQDYLNNPNQIYQKLLANQSILRQLLNSQKSYYKYGLEKFPIEITLYYIKEVLNMTKEQIGLIARISDVIFELSRKEQNYKKYLFMLESAGKAYQLRAALLKIIKANYHCGAEQPVIRMNEYVDYLFPDGQYWGEVRDLLLIHIYERLHDEGINQEEIPDEEILEAIEDEPVNTL